MSGQLLLVTLNVVGVTVGGEDYQWDHNVFGVFAVVNICAPVETCGCVEIAYTSTRFSFVANEHLKGESIVCAAAYAP